jgi:hypothetical protein
MTFNQFKLELERRNIPPQEAYMFALIYERLIHMAGEIEAGARATLALANTIEGFVELHEATQGKLQQMMRGGVEGVDVFSESVVDDPEKKKN